MELVYETELSEKETIKLFMRRCRFWGNLRRNCAIMSVLWTLGAIFYLYVMCDGCGFSTTELLVSIFGALSFLTCFFIVDQILARRVRRAYRQRKTHRVEYRLRDDELVFSAGETACSSPWSKLAKKFRIDRKAIYLYGKDLPFEAQCIPEWRGHGVERKELVAILKKAGLKKMINGWLKFLVGLAVTFILITCYFYIGGIEWGDWTIPNEAELRLEKRDVPDEDNAYLALIALTNLYRVAEGDDESAEISDKPFVRYYGNPSFTDGDDDERKEWVAVRTDPASPKRAEKILAENAKFFDAFRAALSFKYFVDTDARLEDAKRKKEGKGPWVCYLAPYKPAVEFAQLVALRAQVALEHDEVESAVSAIGEIHALGQLVMVNNEWLFAYLVGALIEKISFGKMCDVVAMSKATDEDIERFSKMVAVSEADAPTAWKRALTAEASRHSEGIEWICDHPTQTIGALLFRNFDEYGNMTSPSLLCRILSNWPGFAKFSFHRREMLYRQAMLDRALIAGDDDLMEMILHEIPRNPLLPNCAGNFLDYSLCLFLNSDAKSGSLDRIRPRLVIAAEKWRRAHGGENPPTLEALVPDYLAAVPRDPWDRKDAPLNYDAALGVAWSVGRDGNYDYRKVAKNNAAAVEKASTDGRMQTYAFRLDGKPMAVSDPSGHTNKSLENCNVEPLEEIQPSGKAKDQSREKPQKEEGAPADVKPRVWLVPIASCRAAVKGRYDSRVFITGMERGLVEGEVISPGVDKCGYRVLSISDRCVWFEAFNDNEPPDGNLPCNGWPDFSRIDTTPPTPPPGCLMLGKRKFWPGEAIKLASSGYYLTVDDFLDGKAVVFRLLDSGMRPVRDLLCVIVREEK